jgi:hypothetical protein
MPGVSTATAGSPSQPEGATLCKVWRSAEDVIRRHRISAKQVAQVIGLVGPVDETNLPQLGQLGGQRLRIRSGVGFVDESEVCLESVKNFSVGVE